MPYSRFLQINATDLLKPLPQNLCSFGTQENKTATLFLLVSTSTNKEMHTPTNLHSDHSIANPSVYRWSKDLAAYYPENTGWILWILYRKSYLPHIWNGFPQLNHKFLYVWLVCTVANKQNLFPIQLLIKSTSGNKIVYARLHSCLQCSQF